MWLFKKLNNALLFFSFCPFLLFSQENELVRNISKKYVEENGVYLYKKTHVFIYMKNKTPKVKVEEYEEEMILKDLFSMDDKEEVYFSNFRKLTEIEASTKIPNGTKFKEIKVKDFKTRDDLDDEIFSNDIKITTIQFPQLIKGAIKCHKKVFEYEYAEFFGRVIIQASLPIEKEEIILEIDPEIEVEKLPFNFGNLKYNLDSTISKKSKIYRYTFQDLKKLSSEPMSCDYLKVYPHLNIKIKNYTLEDKKINVMETPEDLFKFNSQFLEKVNNETSEKFKNLALELTKDKSTDIERVKAIYYWVKKNIKYIAFEAGLEGFVPRDANSVFEKRYGDCKDMANLIFTLAQEAGIKNVYRAWIGTSKLPYSIQYFASPIIFNHMISVYRTDEKTFFLDATDAFVDMKLPTEFIQGKEALLYKNKSEYEIVPVPFVEKQYNFKNISIKMTINNDQLEGSVVTRIGGYQKLIYLRKIYDANSERKKQFLKNYLEVGNNKFSYTDLKETNTENPDSNALLEYKFVLQNYITKANQEIFVNMLMAKYGSMDELKDDRISNIDLSMESTNTIHVELAIPEGYQVEFLPENIDKSSSFGRLKVQYSKNETSVTCAYSFEYHQAEIPKEKYQEFNDFQKSISDAYLETISLKKIN
jgi:hypothetical protein